MIWVSFFYKGKELCSYDLENSFEGEFTATRELHASELCCSIDDIKVFIVQGKKKLYEVLGECANTLKVRKVG